MLARSPLLVQVLLFVSGAAGLVYEVCWSRELGLWLGRGERGATVTLTSFFGGMALGYALAGRTSARVTRPLRAYALCELVVAGCAASLPALGTQVSPQAGGWLWLAMIPPTIAMGASLPFAQQAVAARAGDVARAYTVHLVGATLGALGTTFVAIARLGVWHSTYVAAALSAGCAVLAWLAGDPPVQASAALPSSVPAAAWRIAAGCAGALTLALQVLCIRLFALTFPNSTYTFGLIVAVFIVLLALGSRHGARTSAQGVDARRDAARGALVAAVGVAVLAPLLAAMTQWGMLRAPSFGAYVLLATGLVLVLLLVPVSAAGTLLPALWRAAGGRVGSTVGALTAANSAGAALGAWLASFVLLPRLGAITSLAWVAAGYALLGAWLGARVRLTLPFTALALGAALASSRLALPTPAGHVLVQRWQTRHGMLDLLRSEDGSESARLDLHYQLGSSRDRTRHLLMGELPLALHPAPRRALFIGLATGMTASAAVPVKSLAQIEAVELIAEVTELARRFGAHNARLLEEPRVHVSIDDGRAYLARTSARFDVIVSDLFVPWHSETGYLYTVEHYRAVRAHLSASGVFAQWLPLWQLGDAELDLITNSFCTVFPGASVWAELSDPDRALLALVAGPLPAKLPRSRATPLGTLTRCERAPLNTDEHPHLEFRAPRAEQDRALLTGARLDALLRARFGAGQ